MIDGQPLAVFQPFIDTATGRIAGIEALGRLRQDDGSLRSVGPLFTDPKIPASQLRRLDRQIREDALARLAELRLDNPIRAIRERAQMSQAIFARALNVTTSQASSRHLKIRLRHTTRTGTPAQGRSWSTTSRRPWPVASTPQDGHPTSVGEVSTTTVNERGPRSTALTWTSGRSKSAHAGAQIA